ncbi:hypothetical protein K7I03_28510 [Streptomyces mobaraensis]|nr:MULTISPECIES: hypothetical protein [Streptomyces]MBC2878067.1 hypothetical protein [Streptomyces sp. TYQ1024]UBI41305.1 hypothetical protein K7I03_28510 [Streptomyces mobaraensis]UKW33804.1 hypothetical protein MCU78_28440 [Streptomyces sp. TYQ1024]
MARPTSTGFTGVYVHWDGYPSHHLPLLLAAYQHRFAGDLEAMSQHLVDNVSVGWSELGTDLLDGAPEPLRQALAGSENHPSSQLDDLITPDGSPPRRMTVTEASTEGLDWGYILRPHGIEVIHQYEDRGPVVGWKTDPRARFSDGYARWTPGGPVPATAPPRTTQPPAPAKSAATSIARNAARR